jgi:cobalt-zinc-cadmium resistance protein CzcA
MVLLIGSVRAALIACLAIPLSMLFAGVGDGGQRGFGKFDEPGCSGLWTPGGWFAGDCGELRSALRARSSQKNLPFADRLKRVACRRFRSGGTCCERHASDHCPCTYRFSVCPEWKARCFARWAATVLFALVGSLLVCLTIVPVLTALFLRPQGHKKSSGNLMGKISGIYLRLLNVSLRHRLALTASSLVLVLVSGLFFFRLGSDFVPQLDEGDLAIGIVRDGNISLDESVRLQKETEKVILQFPEIKNVFARMGTPESATDPMGVNFADTFLIWKRTEESGVKTLTVQPSAKTNCMRK